MCIGMRKYGDALCYISHKLKEEGWSHRVNEAGKGTENQGKKALSLNINVGDEDKKSRGLVIRQGRKSGQAEQVPKGWNR